MTDMIDLRMHQHIAHEIYRQQMLQRIPDPFPSMLPVPIPQMHAMALPPRYQQLPGVEMKLQNKELWRDFHKIGTEMIITKCGRRMFPSMRLTVDGLDADTNYCVLLEMMPISDCRFKFSGSQWVPAGGAEPQSPQRFCLHPDSPALGTHWASQPIVFNKVKLTNNTLDNNGHVVLTSMHKYQPRIHIIRTADPSQIPWAAQQAFVFPETEFVAVTAYQNDRITKLKIDHNPFAKGFRETGQSRCKRKLGSTGHGGNTSTSSSSSSSSGTCGQMTDDEDRNDQLHDLLLAKRSRSNEAGPDGGLVEDGSDAALRLQMAQMQRCFPPGSSAAMANELLMRQYNQMFNPSWMDLMMPYFARNPYQQQHPPLQQHQFPPGPHPHQHHQGHPGFLPLMNHPVPPGLLPMSHQPQPQPTGSPLGGLLAPQISPTESLPESDRSSAFSVTQQQVPRESTPPVEEVATPEPGSESPREGAAGGAAAGEDNKKVNFSIASILLL
ncbi:T-box transcription factor TBX6-like [Culex pipiens pallens]|uniref:T-box transcription factor TBX6-like n=1 Tax=Culex pipiens pallens TaxID=42434 RepID=UPI0019543BBD|nr:T-box transcription factor TBX6-like [Culex pipiens pallens]